MKKPATIVLDSWAILAYLQDEPAAERIADMIADAQERGISLLMSVVNAGEVWYTLARRASVKDADETIGNLRQIGVRIVDADWQLTHIAAGYKAKGGISYADCFAAALTKTASGADRRSAVLITGDQEFRQLEKDLTIEWL
jgi:predicted nucleic acid-binding protein